MAIYTRFGEPVTIVDARYEWQTNEVTGQKFAAMIVDIQYEDGMIDRDGYGSFLKADNGLQEITEAINKLKGYDLWAKFNGVVKTNPVLRIEVGTWTDGSKGRVVHIRWYRKHSHEIDNRSWRDYTFDAENYQERLRAEFRINKLIEAGLLRVSNITLMFDGMETEFVPNEK